MKSLLKSTLFYFSIVVLTASNCSKDMRSEPSKSAYEYDKKSEQGMLQRLDLSTEINEKNAQPLKTPNQNVKDFSTISNEAKNSSINNDQVEKQQTMETGIQNNFQLVPYQNTGKMIKLVEKAPILEKYQELLTKLKSIKKDPEPILITELRNKLITVRGKSKKALKTGCRETILNSVKKTKTGLIPTSPTIMD